MGILPNETPDYSATTLPHDSLCIIKPPEVLIKSEQAQHVHHPMTPIHKTPFFGKVLLLLPLLVSPIYAAFPDCVNGPLATNLVCNTSANFMDRAKALVAEFTLADMISNTGYQTPGVSRLGLPAYTWWSEALVSLWFLRV